jgi:DNA-3-methyladenine glycosylase
VRAELHDLVTAARGAAGRKVRAELYDLPAAEAATAFLGKVLVHRTATARLTGVICDVEAYPAFVDRVHHGNKRTARSDVMWQPGGRAYVYLIYGIWHQFAAVVNAEGIPDVVFIRGVYPVEGYAVMAASWDKPQTPATVAGSPGKLCRSFGITMDHYGVDLTGDRLYLEDRGLAVSSGRIIRSSRVGINTTREGHDAPLRYTVKPSDLAPA